jgi:hypothetical protein
VTVDQLLPVFYEADPPPPKDSNLLEVHTSDLQNFLRCRRKWNWQSRLRENLIAIGSAIGPLWFGSGIHFALEDYHGWRRWQDPREAFAAYYDAFKESELPVDHDTLLDLGFGMLDYYHRHWLPTHPDEYQTLWVNDLPQVEVDVHIPLNQLLWDYAEAAGRLTDVLKLLLTTVEIVYSLTFDRVVLDVYDRILGVDYKTARQIDTGKLANDFNVGAYHWGLTKFYQDQAEGMIWQQFLKDVPHPPKRLVNGTFSQNKQQNTTYMLYREALIKRFGKVPAQYIEFLNYLSNQQTYEGDKFIRRDIQRRNKAQSQSTETKILQITLDMFDAALPLYPNPTRDCSWDCPFKDPCLAMDDGSDFSYMLSTAYTQWKGYKDDWRERIEWPEESDATLHVVK